MRAKPLILAVLLLCIGSAYALAQARSNPPVKSVMSNGLTLLIKSEPEASTVAINIFVRIGAADEDKTNQGIGHLLAGTILAGTKSRSTTKYARLFSEVGGSFQAGWQWNYLDVHGVTVPEMCEDAIVLLADSIQESAFRPEAIEFARSSILKQVESAEGDPFNSAYAELRKSMYGDGPYGRSFIGSADCIKRLGRSQLVALYERHFRPNQIVISIAGKVDQARVAARVSKLFGNMMYASRSGGASRSDMPAVQRTVVKTTESATYIMQGYPAPGMTDPDFPAMSVANVLLGGSKSSLLFSRLREELGLGYQVGSLYQPLRGTGHIVTYLGMDSVRATPEAVQSVKDAVSEQVAKLCNGEFTDADLARAKQYLVGTHAVKHERVRDRAFYPGWYEAMGLGYDFDTEYASRIKAVTRENVRAVCENYLVDRGKK